MNALMEYLVKSSLALTVFYFFYWLFLRKDTHFMLNRFILIFLLLLSVVLPLINLNFVQSEPVIPTLNINFESDDVPVAGIITESVESSGWNFWNIVAVIYIAGAALVLLRLLYQGIYMQALSRLSKSEKRNNFTVVYMEKDIVPFSYFNKIFIPISKTGDQGIKSIIDHEKSHLQQLHYVDLFMAEFITVVQWFNPFAWLYEHSVKEIHEYLADKAVLDKGYPQGNYQALLVNQAMGGPVFTISNQFNKSLIKKRIVMMTKMKSPRRAQLKCFLLLPVIAVILMAYAQPEKAIKALKTDFSASTISAPKASEAKTNKPVSQTASSSKEQIKISGKVTHYDSGEPLEGIIAIVKGTTTGAVTDIEGNYTILVPDDNAILVFSHVGYKTQAVPVKGNTVINVMMEQNVLTIDFSKPNYLLPRETSESTSTPKEDNYVVVEEPPTYPGGTVALKKFIEDNLKYPEDAKSKGIFGRVLVNFIIDIDGNVTNAKVLRGVMPSMDEEALRIAKLTTGWKPASQNGNAVASRVIMPVSFKK